MPQRTTAAEIRFRREVVAQIPAHSDSLKVSLLLGALKPEDADLCDVRYAHFGVVPNEIVIAQLQAWAHLAKQNLQVEPIIIKDLAGCIVGVVGFYEFTDIGNTPIEQLAVEVISENEPDGSCGVDLTVSMITLNDYNLVVSYDNWCRVEEDL